MGYDRKELNFYMKLYFFWGMKKFGEVFWFIVKVRNILIVDSFKRLLNSKDFESLSDRGCNLFFLCSYWFSLLIGLFI